MIVGLCEFSLGMPWNRSLKEKRKVVRSLCDRLRSRYRIALAEVADNDVHTRGVLGFAVVGNDRRQVRSVIDAVMETVNETCPADVVEQEVEVMQW